MVCPSLNNTRALDVVSQNPSSSIQELPGVIPRRINTNVRGFRNRVSVVMDLGSHQPTASHNNFVRQDIVPEGITASPAIMSNTAQSLWPATPTSGPIHSETTISSRRSTWKTDSTTELTPSSSYSFYNPAQDTSFGQAPSAPVFYDPSSNCFSNPWPPLFDSHSSNQTVQDNDFKRMSGVGTQPSSDSSFNAPPNLSRFTEDSSFDFDGNPSIATDPPFAGVMEPNIRGPVKAENEIQSAIPNGQLQVESLICPYPDCGTRFTGEMKNQISNMLRHVRREVHSENRVSYACDECPKAYGRSSNLKQHRKSVHEIGT